MPWYATVYDPVDSAPINVRKFNTHKGYDAYVASRNIYGNCVYARDLAHARRLAKKRNCGESVVGEGRAPNYLRASTCLRRRNWFTQAVLHNIMFVSFMALQSGAATAAELFGDEGIVHGLFHQSEPRKKLRERLAEIEARIPGYLGPRFK